MFDDFDTQVQCEEKTFLMLTFTSYEDYEKFWSEVYED